jgi:AcrR family transcriptional regulator
MIRTRKLREHPEPTAFEGRPTGTGVRARTFDHLIDCAMRMTSGGQVPSVSDLAAAAGVSRATAYRYFPSRSKLISAVVDESLGPVRQWESQSTDGVVRLRELFTLTFPRFKEYEAQMRAALQLSLEHWSSERADTLEEEPFKRGFRKGILERTARPLRSKLGEDRFQRLLRALSIIYGIEPYVVMKDIWGANDREIESLVRWVAEALVAASLREIKKD